LETSRTKIFSYYSSIRNSETSDSNISNNINTNEDTNENKGKILTYDHVKCGLRRLGENNIDS
jgi:hypothetical protein